MLPSGTNARPQPQKRAPVSGLVRQIPEQQSRSPPQPVPLGLQETHAPPTQNRPMQLASIIQPGTQALFSQCVPEPQQTPPQGGNALPKQTHVPSTAVPLAGVLQNWPDGQQTRSGPHGTCPLVQWQKGRPVRGASQCEPVGQVLPHTPQLLSVVRSVQTSLQQSEWELTGQTPEPQQTSSETPRQAPLGQGGRAVPKHTHVPSAAVPPGGLIQNWLDGQQTRSGPHGTCPLVQWQKGGPPGVVSQYESAGQTLPHAPQLLSVFRKVQTPSQQLEKMLQQAPPQQNWSARQIREHEPQWFRSLFVSVQPPKQKVCPAGQVT
jgi:hypothetical protein